MSDLISRKALMDELENKNTEFETVIEITDDDETKDIIDKTLKAYREILKDMILNQPTAHDAADNELRILRNHIEQMPKVYRKRNANWVIVQNLLMARTSRAGQTSSIEKCWELNIDAYGYELIAKGGEQDG